MSKELREAAEAARHELVISNGLTASDGLNTYGDALSEGADPNGAWDLFVKQTWKIDNTATIARLDAALGYPRKQTDQPSRAASGEPK